MKNWIRNIILLMLSFVFINCTILFAAEYKYDGNVKVYLNGSLVHGWYKDNGKDYYADASGNLALGFTDIGSNTYFFYTKGENIGEIARGYVNIDYYIYYFNSQGHLLKAGDAPDGRTANIDGALLDDAELEIIGDEGYPETGDANSMMVFVNKMNAIHLSDMNKYAETTAPTKKVAVVVNDISGIVGDADNGVVWNSASPEKRPEAVTNSSSNPAIVLTPEKIKTGGVKIVGKEIILPVLPKETKIVDRRATLDQQEKINKIVAEFKTKYIKRDMTAFEKEMMIIQYLVQNVEYDYQNFVNNTIPDDSYSAYGALVNRVAVCSGYARAFNVLCDACDVPSMYISSSEMNHAWNQVCLEGKWYHVDVTWEDPIIGGNPKNEYGFKNLRNEYINLTDTEMRSKSHVWPESLYNECSSVTYGPSAVATYLMNNK